MQKIFISHTSALNFYNNARVNQNLDVLNFNPIHNSLILKPVSNQPGNIINIESPEIQLVELPFCGEPPIHILTGTNNYNRRTKKFKIHYSKFLYTRNSFFQYEKDIFISSPQLMFCQIAKQMTITELLLLGMELCGTYSLTTSTPEGYIYNLPPLTTAEKIKTYIKNLKKRNTYIPGINKAIYASSIILNNSASPLESNLYLKLAAPRNIGGYEITNLKANETITLSPKARDVLKYDTIRPDLCNKKTKIAIEYDSNAFHNNTKQNEKDKLRASALLLDGWKLFTFVPKQLSDVYSFHNMALEILKENKQEPRIRTKNFEEKRRKFWIELHEATKHQTILS